MKTTRTSCALFLSSKGAAASKGNRSFVTALFFIIISIIRRGRGCILLSHPPSFHLFIHSSLFVCALWDSGHRSQHARLRFALSTEWSHNSVHDSTIDDFVILLIFKSLPKIRFKFVGAENHQRLHCTTHGTSILKSNATLKKFLLLLENCP